MPSTRQSAPLTLLAIECSSAIASVALTHAGQVVGREGETASATVDHVLRWCDEVLRQAGVAPDQLDAVAVGIGPGAFTGVRVAISVAQGLALAWGKRVIPVSSLAALAATTLSDAEAMPVLALMDARMDEVYAGWYESSSGLATALSAEQVLAPESLSSIIPGGSNRYRVTGNGYALYRERVEAVLPPPAQVVDASVPTAAQVAGLASRLGLAASVEPGRVEPAYVRDKVALTTAERAQAARSVR